MSQTVPDSSADGGDSLINNSQYAVEGEYFERNGKFRASLPHVPKDEFLGALQDLRPSLRSELEIIALIQKFSAGLRLAYRDADWSALRTTFLEDKAELLQWYLEPFDAAPTAFSVRIGVISSLDQYWHVPLRLIAGSMHALYIVQVLQQDGEWFIEDILGSTDFVDFSYEAADFSKP